MRVCVVIIMGLFQNEANRGPLHAQQQEQTFLFPPSCFPGQLGQDLWLRPHGLPGLGRTPKAGWGPLPSPGGQGGQSSPFLCANLGFPALLSARDSGLGISDFPLGGKCRKMAAAKLERQHMRDDFTVQFLSVKALLINKNDCGTC